MPECVLIVTPAELPSLDPAVFEAIAHHLVEAVAEALRGSDPAATVTLKIHVEIL